MSDSLVIQTHAVVEERLATYGLHLYVTATSDYLYISEGEPGYVTRCNTIAEVEMFLNGMEYEKRTA